MRRMKMLLTLVTVVAMLAVGATAFAKTKAATLDVKAKVLDLISTVTTTELNFGSLSYTNSTNDGYAILDSTGGYVSDTIAFNTQADNAGTAMTAVMGAGYLAGSGAKSGTLNITATSVGSVTSVTWPASITIQSGTTLGSPTLTVSELATYSEDPAAAAMTVGVNTYALGGALLVKSTSDPGDYTGTATITINY